MDITVIKPEATNETTGIFFGQKEAPVVLKEFINLRCPYCRQWFNHSKEVLDKAVAEGKVIRLLKLTDRPKESLQRGNVMHRYVTTDDSEQAYADIQAIFESQDQWGDLSLEEVAQYAENTLGLTEHNHLDYAQEIVDETQAAVIKFVPTVILNEHIFDESISTEELTKLIEEAAK